MSRPAPAHSVYRTYQRAGLFGGPLLALLLLSTGPLGDMPDTASRAAVLGIWMAVWWLTEAVPIPVTSLLPLVLAPLFGLADIGTVAQPYASPLVFLFLGGFIIGTAIQRWNLHRRVALHVVKASGGHPVLLIGGIMLAAAFVSMWITNTATTLMMLPIGVALIEFQARSGAEGHDLQRFGFCVLLGIAFAATIGGMSTLIGTAPNGLIAAYLLETYNLEIGFTEWLAMAAPLSALLLLFTWLLLTQVVYRFRLGGGGHQDYLRDELAALGPMRTEERVVAGVFLLTAALWVMRKPVNAAFPALEVTDAGIAIFGATLLFLWPRDWRRGEFVLAWREAETLPWGVLILFGGGLSLAAIVQSSGLAEWLGGVITGIDGVTIGGLLVASVVTIILLTELTSNTATTAVFLPVLATAALLAGQNPLLLAVPATLASSCAFMMPVATPPNAIVFSSGRITIPQMAWAGVWMNLLGAILLLVMTRFWIMPAFDIEPDQVPEWAQQQQLSWVGAPGNTGDAL